MSDQNYDAAELDKFTAQAAHWWDPLGDLKTLHHINPVRLCFINEKADLAGKKVIDIGCGGGILAESMASLGATVTGVDLSQPLIEVAKLHLYESGLAVEYLCTSVADIAAERAGEYDVVTCMEMLEHVPDPAAIVQACATLVKPGGQVFFSTINRHPKAYLYAIVGAEYLLKLLPKNTHDYAKFIRPAELCAWARAAQVTPHTLQGMHYQPFTGIASLQPDLSVNYLFYGTRHHG